MTTVSLLVDGTWQDISDDALGRDDIVITSGRASESAATDPSTCSLSIRGGESQVSAGVVGRYSPRNPLSDLYGKLHRNSKIRIERSLTGWEGLRLSGADGSYAYTPDHSSLDITGDLDLRIEAVHDSWRPSTLEILAAKSRGLDQVSWEWHLDRVAGMGFTWTETGIVTTGVGGDLLTANVALPEGAALRALRVTFTSATGTVRFYTADTIAGPWTQLGTDQVWGSAQTIWSGTAAQTVGATHDGTGGVGYLSKVSSPFTGTVTAFEIRNGIDGTVVTSPGFGSAGLGDSGLVDAQGRQWFWPTTTHVVRPDYRFCGGVAAWEPRWDVSGKDVWFPIEASGPLRRLGQGASALRSSLYRDLSTKTNLAAYWPCEDGEDAQSISGVIGGANLGVVGDVTLASASDIDGSDALPAFGTGTLSGRFPSYTEPTNQRIMCLVQVPDTIPGTERSVLQLRSSGTVKLWKLRLNSSGNLVIYGWDKDDTQVTSGTHAVDLRGKTAIVWLLLTKDGTDTEWQIGSVEPNQPIPIGVEIGSVASATPGTFLSGIVGSGADLGGTVIGHVALMDSDVHGAFWDTVNNSLLAWSGEQAHERFIRLADEESIDVYTHGDQSMKMGAQTISTLLELWQQCVDSDMAMFSEYDCDGFLLRAHRTLENTTPRIILDYDSGHLAPSLEPTDDDQQLRNDVTVSRIGGSQERVTLDTGDLSVAQVGRYDAAVDLSLHHDSQLESQAWWRLSLGTWNEARYPSVTIDLLKNPSLAPATLSLEAGDRIRLINLPEWLPPDDVDLLVLGRDETIGADGRHLVTLNCAPAAPWDTWILGEGRAGTSGSELASGITSSATSFSVTTTVGERWIDSATFPAMFGPTFLIKFGGEIARVTDITGTGSTQTFTVIRSRNGVVKSHVAGTAVALAHPARPRL